MKQLPLVVAALALLIHPAEAQDARPLSVSIGAGLASVATDGYPCANRTLGCGFGNYFQAAPSSRGAGTGLSVAARVRYVATPRVVYEVSAGTHAGTSPDAGKINAHPIQGTNDTGFASWLDIGAGYRLRTDGLRPEVAAGVGLVTVSSVESLQTDGGRLRPQAFVGGGLAYDLSERYTARLDGRLRGGFIGTDMFFRGSDLTVSAGVRF